MTGAHAAEGDKRAHRRRFRRGVSIIPALFTTGNLFFGFWAIIKTFNGEYAEAALRIIIAIALDMLDGRIARLTGTASEFGGELDSLADVISFGVAPALLVHAWAFGPISRVGWLAAFVFVVCGTMRLARFNVQRHNVDGRYFVGLPIPAGAGQVAVLVQFLPDPVIYRPLSLVVAGLTIALSLLMVSTLRYPSFKGVDLRSRRSYLVVLLIALLFVAIKAHPEWFLLGLASIYSLSAPTLHAFGLLRRKGAVAPAAPARPT